MTEALTLDIRVELPWWRYLFARAVHIYAWTSAFAGRSVGEDALVEWAVGVVARNTRIFFDDGDEAWLLK
ncbi:hypothetical protein ATO13_23216 [Stappia sp. 22II-S9-Z10]|nr:hypothetical protein ATO13_23216 [Stappia sp. 22II-S9-Z10]